MINQINNSNSVTRNVFSPFQNSGENFAISKPFTETQKTEHEKSKEKKSKKLGIAIASAGLTIGFGLLLVAKVLSKKPGGIFNKVLKKVEIKTDALKDNKQRTTIQNLFYTGLKYTKNFLRRSEALFTFATVKDIIFRKSLKGIPGVGKVSDKITNFFQKVSVQTSQKAYRTTRNHFESLYVKLENINNKLNLPNNDPNKTKITKIIKNIQEHYNKGFSEVAQHKRLSVAELPKNLGNIDERIWDATYKHPIHFFKDPKTYNKFLAKTEAGPIKYRFNETIYDAKDQINFSLRNKFKATKALVNRIDRFIDPTCETPRNLMNSLKTHVNTYSKVIKEGNKSLEFPQKIIAEDLEKLKDYIPQTDKEDYEDIIKSIDKLVGRFKNNEQGEIQDLMDIYKGYLDKGVLSKEEYTNLEKSVNHAINSLDYSADLEGDKLFDKIRDLKLGSAIHDTIALVGSLGIIGWYLGKADNNDERISASLKYGIPTIGAVSIALLCTVGLIASGPSLIIGLVSGLAINKLGEAVDGYRKEHNSKKVKSTPVNPE